MEQKLNTVVSPDTYEKFIKNCALFSQHGLYDVQEPILMKGLYGHCANGYTADYPFDEAHKNGVQPIRIINNDVKYTGAPYSIKWKDPDEFEFYIDLLDGIPPKPNMNVLSHAINYIVRLINNGITIDSKIEPLTEHETQLFEQHFYIEHHVPIVTVATHTKLKALPKDYDSFVDDPTKHASIVKSENDANTYGHYIIREIDTDNIVPVKLNATYTIPYNTNNNELESKYLTNHIRFILDMYDLK